MNDHKFCFIICTNDDILLNECIHYLNHLIVPDGFEIDLLTISGANSITEGYQEARVQSDAKYKLYMHQDVFILNRYLLQDLLSIFESDSEIGLVGMVGYEKVSPNGIMWHMPRLGSVYLMKPEDSYPSLDTYKYSVTDDHYFSVALVDGLFMATSQDIPWNTELLKGWDFYDAFQSVAFLQHGYKVVVPNQKHPWCLHDDAKILNMFRYDENRQIFLSHHKDVLGKYHYEIRKQ